MLCDICHKNEATIHIQEIVGNQKKAMHLCGECAAAKQAAAGFDFGPFNLAEVLYKLSGQQPPAKDGGADNPHPALTCPKCGWDEQKLRRTGQLGCAHCYTVFAPLLAEALKNMHRGASHLGKHPAGGSEALELRQCRDRLNQLQKQLQQAVEAEEYENAALLRDRINALKAKCDEVAAQGKGGTGNEQQR